MMNKRIMLSIVLGVFAIAAGVGQTPTRLQVFVTKDEAKAQSLAAELNAINAGPSRITTTTEGLYKVSTKLYDSLAAANLAKPYIVGKGFTNAFAVSEDVDRSNPIVQQSNSIAGNWEEKIPSVTALGSFNQEMFDVVVAKPQYPKFNKTQELETVSNISGSETALFQKAFSYNKLSQTTSAIESLEAFTNRFPNSTDAVVARMKLAYWYVTAKKSLKAKGTFQSVIKDYPDNELAGEAMLRLGYLAIQENDHSNALKLFHGLASGKVPAADDVKAESVLRTAALFHRGKDLESSRACYQVVLSSFTDPTVRAFAQVHLAGLELELAWNGKSSFESARQLSEKTLNDFPRAPKSVRATAAVMILETLAYEKRYDALLAKEGIAMKEASDSPEAPLVHYWIARAYMETGNPEAAGRVAESLIDSSDETAKRFASVDLSEQARRLAVKAYTKAGNIQKVKSLSNN